jgi:hypothetical protein
MIEPIEWIEAVGCRNQQHLHVSTLQKLSLFCARYFGANAASLLQSAADGFMTG